MEQCLKFYSINYTIDIGEKYVGIAVVKAINPNKAVDVFKSESSFNGYRSNLKVTKIEEVQNSILPSLNLEEYMREHAIEVLKLNDFNVENGGINEAPIDEFQYTRGNKTWNKLDLSTKVNNTEYLADKKTFALKAEIPSLDGYLKKIPDDYITETKLNQKGYLTQHQSLEGYAKENWVKNEIANAQLSGNGDVNLEGYATQDWVNQQSFLKEVPSEFITETELNNKKYLTEHQDISGKLDRSVYTKDKSTFALKTEIPKDYLTANDIKNKADKSEIPSIVGLATKSEIADMETKSNASATYQPKGSYLTEVPATYATQDWTNQQGFLKKHQSLSEYALKSEIKTKTSQLFNDSNFISSIPKEYVTDTELNQKGYLTKHQDISNKADKIKVLTGSTNTIKPNTYYEFGEVTNLKLTLSAEISGIYNEYMFEFKSGATPTKLELPSTIKWKTQPKVVANKRYIVSIVNNYGLIGEFAV